MNNKSILAILAGTLALAACTNDNAPRMEAETAARFFTNLEERVQTRMADDQWDENDAIGIFTLNDEQAGVKLPDGSTAPSNLRKNMKYTRTGEGQWTSAAPFYFKNPTAPTVKFAAYYPHTDDAQITGMDVQDGKLAGTIAVDASDQSKQATFDFLYADKDGSGAEANTPQGDKNNPQVKFHFKHSMTKVVIKLLPDTDGGSTTFADIQNLVPTLTGFIPTGTFSLADGKVAAAQFDGTVAAQGLTLSNKTEDAENSVSYVAILPPQTTQGGSDQKDPEITLTDQTNNYRSAKILTGKTLDAGKCYTVTITVKKKTLVVESSDISDWTEETGGSGDAILQ